MNPPAPIPVVLVPPPQITPAPTAFGPDVVFNAQPQYTANAESMRLRFPEYRMQSSPLLHMPADTTSAIIPPDFNPFLEALLVHKSIKNISPKMAKWRFVDPREPSVIGGSTPSFMMQHLNLGMQSLGSGHPDHQYPKPLANEMAIPWIVAGLYGIHNPGAHTAEEWKRVVIYALSLARSNASRQKKALFMPEILIARLETNRTHPVFALVNAWAFLQWHNLWDGVEQAIVQLYVNSGANPAFLKNNNEDTKAKLIKDEDIRNIRARLLQLLATGRDMLQ